MPNPTTDTPYVLAMVALEGAKLWHAFTMERSAALVPDTRAWHAWLDTHCAGSYDHPLCTTVQAVRDHVLKIATAAPQLLGGL